MLRSSETHGNPVNPRPTNGNGNLLSFFGLRRSPFSVNPDPRQLFWTPQATRAFSALTAAVESGKDLVVLTGEVGTGKTTLINLLLNSLRERRLPVAFVFNSQLDINSLYDFILADFGIKEDPSRPPNPRKALHDWLYASRRARRRPILIVDEAQGLAFAVLEELRMLLNLEMEGEKLIQIVLSGQPELEATLAKPQMLQLRQRISLRCKTAPLTKAETHDYIVRRLQSAGAQPGDVFAQESLDAIFFYSGGTPRVINLLCEQALLNARAQEILPVSAGIVEEVAREFQFDEFKPFPRSLDFSAPTVADILPITTSPTKMRMALMAARETTPSPGIPEPSTPSRAPIPSPRIAPLPTPPPVIPIESVSSPLQPQSPVSAPPPVHAAHEASIHETLPAHARVQLALEPALHAVRRAFLASSRWLRQPMHVERKIS